MTPIRRTAIYPGSFDPVTHGHEDIARRGLQLAERVIVAVAHTPTQTKAPLFSVAQRLEMLNEVFEQEPRIESRAFSGLLVDFAAEIGAHVVLRGLRAVSDFEYEFQMAQMNRELLPELETVFLTTHPEHAFLSASLIRQVSALGGDVSNFVSASVLRRLKEKHS